MKLKRLSDSRIYLSPPHITEHDISQITATLKEGWVSTVGPELQVFEQKLAERLGVNYVLCLNSGTAALHLAVKLAGIERGDTVLIGTFTFVAAANAVLYEGGRPVFIDSDMDSWNLDPQVLLDYLESCSESEIPKALIVTHIFGTPANMTSLCAICKNYDIKLIEDAAEAFGSSYHGKSLGGFGGYGVLSFNGNKILTTGGGGALVCKEKADYENALFWATQSKEATLSYTHAEIGYNYRMSNVLAGLGISQLDQLDFMLEKKRSIANRYKTMLSGSVFEFPSLKDGEQSNHWLSVVLIKSLVKLLPIELVKAMEEENIEAKLFWKPLHMQPLFSGSKYLGEFNIAERLFKQGVCLPSGVGLTEKDQERVVETILNCIKGKII